MSAPKLLYLHGFASSRDSAKGVWLSRHFAARGADLERLDVRVPSFEHLRLSAMIDVLCAAIGGERDRAVVFGSSLGGLTAARTAERDPRVSALVLLAPAFQLVRRWRARVADPAWRDWEATGWLEVDDYMTKSKSRVDFEFARDVERVEDTLFPDVRVPTLIVHGARDEVVDVNLSREFARDKRWVRLVEVDDGHDLGASLERIAEEADRFLVPFLG